MAILEEVERYRAVRDELERVVLPLAHSLDGHAFSWQASLHGLAFEVGGYVMVETAAGAWLGQVLDMRIDEVVAAEIGFAVGNGEGSTIRSAVSVRVARGHGALLEGPGAPFADARARIATSDEVRAWAQRRAAAGSPLPIGELARSPGVVGAIDARGFGRHTFLCGQSGSGKTHALGVILEQILARTTLRVVVLDPNSDYVALGRVRDGADPDAAERHMTVADGVVVRSAGDADDDARLHLRFGELAGEEQAALLRLDPIADREEYAALQELIRENRPPSVEGMAELGTDEARRLGQRAGNLGLGELGVWSRGATGTVLEALATPDVRCLVVDLGSLATRTEMALVSEAVLAALWRRRTEREPVLIVIDEAHNVCPARPTDELTALASEHVVRIAAEGRKFGLYLLLCTQRPQKVPENAISQCDNLVLMRLNARDDAAFAQQVFSFVPPGLVGLAPTFGLGESLVAGRIAPDPTLVRFGERVSQEGGADVPSTWARAGV
jgi:hypothetical protein